MSVWRNEEDFMRNMDNMLSEFYIKDKKVTTPKKMNVQTHRPDKSWYESDSDDECNEKVLNADGSTCPSMESMDTLQMMHSIRMQVRNVVGDRYNNDVIETYYKMDQESVSEPCESNKIPEGATVTFVKQEVNDSSNNKDTKVKKNSSSSSSVNGHKTNVEEPIASTSKLNNSNNGGNKFHSRGKTISNRAGSRGSSRYHNNVAFASFQSKESYNYKSKSDFPPL